MPYKILKKEELGNSGTLVEMDIETPLIAKKAHAGNFILIRVNETGERFPLTIADYDREHVAYQEKHGNDGEICQNCWSEVWEHMESFIESKGPTRRSDDE